MTPFSTVLMGEKEGIASLTHDEFWEKDLTPQGNRGFQPRGAAYTVVCDFDAPDEHRWRSTRVSGVDNKDSSLVFELLTENAPA